MLGALQRCQQPDVMCVLSSACNGGMAADVGVSCSVACLVACAAHETTALMQVKLWVLLY